MKNIILIGMSASGKSTVGVVVAKRLGMNFLDTDLLIQEQEHALLSEIIENKGIEEFSRIENEVNLRVDVSNTVIAPGGSVVYCKAAMEHYLEIGKIVYLKAPFEVIEKRIRNVKDRGIVIKEGQSLRDVYDERETLFEKYANIIIDEKNLDLEETIDKVLDAISNI